MVNNTSTAYQELEFIEMQYSCILAAAYDTAVDKFLYPFHSQQGLQSITKKQIEH